MPVDWSKYPADWKEIAERVKTESDWKCEICGRQCRRPGESDGIILTVMHLDHDESNCKRDNLMAGCSVCHLRYDARTKAQRRKGQEKQADIREDLKNVYNLTIKDRRREFMREHNRWPRGVENDKMQLEIPIVARLWPEEYEDLRKEMEGKG